MVLSNSEMSKNISFHVAFCAKGFTKDGDSLQMACSHSGLFPLVCNGVKEENLGARFSLPKRGLDEVVGPVDS